jgi:ribosomal protein S18 acetylase RimI-like enzyme
MQVALRQATFADALRVATLLIETRLQCMPYAPCAYSDDEVRAWVASELVPSAGVTVAEHDGQVIGVVATAREAQASWITQMAVDPATLGRGIGSALLAHVMHSLTPPIRLFTFQANSGARRFYERHGFVAVRFSDGQANQEHCPDVLYERIYAHLKPLQE